MLYLLDTGILLRVFNRADPNCVDIRRALWILRKNGHRFAIPPQVVSEFWNVSTRPAEARGGYGLSVEETDRRVRIVERICSILPDMAHTYGVWRDLVKAHSVRGVQVHDARLVAWMTTQGISHVLTLNAGDFTRYSGVVAVWPVTVVRNG